ncbi:hypothetical protein ACQVWA_26795 [Bacillus cereus]|uniref:hypothetical protein n=1 Tax=Bacillus cereus TaxID=1396 RepID=UPI003D654CF2
MNTKIPCIVLIFYNFDIIKKSLEFLAEYSDRLDFYIIENPSIHTETKIKPYILSLVNKNIVSKYVLFSNNISNNAIEIFFKHEMVKQLEQYKYILFTDGDVTVKNNDFLSEEIQILDQHPEVFTCGVTINLDNLPLQNYPTAGSWIPPIIKEFPLFNEGLTGGQLLLFRTKEFLKYLEYIQLHNLKFVDGTMHTFCYKILNKKWARTKNSECIHLTWDIYSDKNHPYHKWKSQHSFQDLWYHNNYCSFEVFTKDSLLRE